MTLRWTHSSEQLNRWQSSQMKIDDGKSRVILPPELRKHGMDPGFWYLQAHVGDNFLAEDGVVLYAPFEIGNNVYVGFNTVIHPNCQIGNDVKIESGCSVPEHTVIADGYTWTKADEIAYYHYSLKSSCNLWLRA